MPTPIPDFVIYCCELLSAVGRVSARRMFGGFGLTCESMNFAFIVSDTLYIKVDAENRAQFERAQCEPFRYNKKSGEVAVMSYFTVPPEAMESPGEMAQWARLGMAAARRAAMKKSAPARKRVTAALTAKPLAINPKTVAAKRVKKV